MVYVDMLTSTIPNEKWQYEQGCHLLADTIDELHVFAKKIGLKREWFQSSVALPHYDLTKNKRYQAMKQGAIEIDRDKVSEMMKRNRHA